MDYYLLTNCCGSYSTYDFDDILHCKKCFHEVSLGEGDGVLISIKPTLNSSSFQVVEWLSNRFSTLIREMLSGIEMAKVNRQNKREPQYCATHEYCDPNEAMCVAMDELFGSTEWDLADSFIENLIDEAWTLSKNKRFTVQPTISLKKPTIKMSKISKGAN
jgi:hypothetical protein